MSALVKHIPNFITLTSLTLGIVNIALAIENNFDYTIALFMASAFLDFMDGLSARVFKAQTSLGVQLDSFADYTCFVIVPYLVSYLYLKNEIFLVVALPYVILGVLRLASFNINSGKADDSFKGIPTPLAAAMAFGAFQIIQGPFVLYVDQLLNYDILGHQLSGTNYTSIAMGVLMGIIGLLMVSGIRIRNYKREKGRLLKTAIASGVLGILSNLLIPGAWLYSASVIFALLSVKGK